MRRRADADEIEALLRREGFDQRWLLWMQTHLSDRQVGACIVLLLAGLYASLIASALG